MARFDDYATKYQTVRMERRDGILQMTFHTGGGPLQWGLLPHGEFPQAFRDVGSDPENKVVIITGTGDTYSGPRAAGGTGMRSTPAQWDRVYWEGKHLLMSLLDIEVPMISAINGPAWRHSEIPLLCDIVLAADDVQFQDSAHFPNGMVPGAGPTPPPARRGGRPPPGRGPTARRAPARLGVPWRAGARARARPAARPPPPPPPPAPPPSPGGPPPMSRAPYLSCETTRCG